MSVSKVTRRIGIFGHVGNGNLGDEAIISAVIENIKRRYPSAQIYGFTLNPRDTSERHKITAFPLRRIDKNQENITPSSQDQVGNNDSNLSALLDRIKIKLKSFPLFFSFLKRIQKIWYVLVVSLKELPFILQSYRNMRGIDLLIIAGSQQLIDYVAGGPWGHPYTIFKWVLIAKANKTKVAFVSCGAGPINTILGRFFIRFSLSLANYRSFRDELSKKCVEHLGCADKNFVFPDLAYSLCINESVLDLSSSSHQLVVGINTIPFFDAQGWVGGGAHAYEIYIGKLICFALWLIQRDYKILLFPTQLRADPPVIEDMRRLISNNTKLDIEKNFIDFPVHSFTDLITAISMMDIVVATRFHGVVIPYLLNKPVLGIAYAKKTNELMKQMDQDEYALDILKFNMNLLHERFISLESKKEENKRKIAQWVKTNREALDYQYDLVFGLLSGHFK